MIGVFDSWFWGYYTLGLLKESFSDCDFIFYADTKNLPYGEKSWEEIKKFTFEALDYLFNNWAKIVILACNTASAYSIKKWQAEFPEKKVLSVTIPGIEKIIENDYKNVWVFATNATVKSDIYRKKTEELNWKNISLFQVWCPKLVDIVENKEENNEYINSIISEYKQNLWEEKIDALILGCTHFPLLKNHFSKHFTCEIIDPSYESVIKLKKYFENHKEIYDSISKNWKTIIETSGENKF
jgi:glutamate racemase